jgi:hypothetical protein
VPILFFSESLHESSSGKDLFGMHMSTYYHWVLILFYSLRNLAVPVCSPGSSVIKYQRQIHFDIW